jgi:hypothetical protein
MQKGKIFPLIEVEQKRPRATCSVERATPQRISCIVSNRIRVWRPQNESGKLRYVAPFALWLDIRVAGTEPKSVDLI